MSTIYMNTCNEIECKHKLNKLKQWLWRTDKRPRECDGIPIYPGSSTDANIL